jgi:hypothetical protein
MGHDNSGSVGNSVHRDLFPQFTPYQLVDVVEQGRIPRHETWGGMIARGELAIDSLPTLAAVEHTAAAQRELDERILQDIA